MNIAVGESPRDARCSRFLTALVMSLALHASAVMAMATAPEKSPGARSESAYSPLQTRLASDSRVASFDAGLTKTAASPASDETGAKPVRGAVSPIYYKPSQLDTRPHIVTRVDPVYPSGIPPAGGKARIRLFINERGFVDRVAIEESTGSAKFGEAAAEAFRAAQFAPGKLKGTAVKSQVLIEVVFHSLLPPGVK